MHEWVKAWVSELSEVKWGEVSWVSEWQDPTWHRALTASCLLPCHERSFKEISQKIFPIISSQQDAILSTDMYSIRKSLWWVWKGQDSEQLKNYSSKERTSKGLQTAMLLPSNEDNKKQLTQMLRELWEIDSYAMSLQDRYKTFWFVQYNVFDPHIVPYSSNLPFPHRSVHPVLRHILYSRLHDCIFCLKGNQITREVTESHLAMSSRAHDNV